MSSKCQKIVSHLIYIKNKNKLRIFNKIRQVRKFEIKFKCGKSELKYLNFIYFFNIMQLYEENAFFK